MEQHYVDPLSYVYSIELNSEKVPLNVSAAMVTASHAVFHGDGHKKAPAAVVGFQFKHERLSEWFENITSSVSLNFELWNNHKIRNSVIILYVSFTFSFSVNIIRSVRLAFLTTGIVTWLIATDGWS